jgi:hypothetical protein
LRPIAHHQEAPRRANKTGADKLRSPTPDVGSGVVLNVEHALKLVAALGLLILDRPLACVRDQRSPTSS